jgi:hypothetical protein
MLLVALSPWMANAALSPEWSHEYAKALKLASGAGKPLVVFVGSGTEGWRTVAEGGVSPEALKLLKERYVCLYVDTATTEGREVADSFEVGRRTALIISDKAAKYQAYKQPGPIASASLDEVLQKYVAYQIPESQIQRASYYSGPPAGTPTYTGGFGGGFGRGCST